VTPLELQIWALRAAGLTLRQISERAGVSYRQVRRAMAERPATPPPRPLFYEHSPGPGACAWPTSDGRPWRFCAADREPGGVYCASHRRIATGTRVREEAA
jgi:hypothetical protein